jgi:hypothetical protein
VTLGRVMITIWIVWRLVDLLAIWFGVYPLDPSIAFHDALEDGFAFVGLRLIIWADSRANRRNPAHDSEPRSTRLLLGGLVVLAWVAIGAVGMAQTPDPPADFSHGACGAYGIWWPARSDGFCWGSDMHGAYTVVCPANELPSPEGRCTKLPESPK